MTPFFSRQVRLVGMSPKKTGIKRAEVLRQFVIDGLLEGLRLSPDSDATISV